MSGDDDTTEWEWVTYAKQGPGVNRGTTPVSVASVVITPAKSIRFNAAARKRVIDASGGDWSVADLSHIRYLVAQGQGYVGFEPADEGELNAYSLTGGAASFQAVMSTFDVVAPPESAMVELRDDEDVPYIDMNSLPWIDDGDSDGDDGGESA